MVGTSDKAEEEEKNTEASFAHSDLFFPDLLLLDLKRVSGFSSEIVECAVSDVFSLRCFDVVAVPDSVVLSDAFSRSPVLVATVPCSIEWEQPLSASFVEPLC